MSNMHKEDTCMKTAIRGMFIVSALAVLGGWGGHYRGARRWR
jgi:hypothetical protein